MQHSKLGVNAQREEIELLRLMRILWRYKKFIVCGTVLVTIVAAMISFILPKVYEVSTIFEPGKNGSDVLSPESLKESILGEAYDYRIRQDLAISYGKYPKINVSIPKGTSIVKISVETSTPETSTKILEKLMEYIKIEINQRLEYDMGQIKNQIKEAKIKNKTIEEKIALTKKQLDETSRKIKTLDKNKQTAISTSADGAMHVLLYSNEIQDQQIYLNNLQEKLKNYEEEGRGADIRIDNLQLQLSRLKGMSVLKPVTVSEDPVRPRKGRIIALAFIIGMTGTVIASLVFNSLGYSQKD